MKLNSLLERFAFVALLLVVVVGVVVFTRSGSTAPSPRARASAAAAEATSAAVAERRSTVGASSLPAEARTTIERIQAGGPFPYDRDGIVFVNREGLLPAEPRGFYHEYTVATPGEGDRGARRIVQASSGVLYWSPDHYRTFQQIALDR